MANIEEVSEYITTKILKNEEFIKAEEETKTRAVEEAEQQLIHFYGKKRTLPIEAISYQTLWIMRSDDTTQKAQEGIRSISLNGISISIGSPKPFISPEVLRILGRRIGSYHV